MKINYQHIELYSPVTGSVYFPFQNIVFNSTKTCFKNRMSRNEVVPTTGILTFVKNNIKLLFNIKNLNK